MNEHLFNFLTELELDRFKNSPSVYGTTLVTGGCGWGDGIPVIWILEALQLRFGSDVELCDFGSGKSGVTMIDRLLGFGMLIDDRMPSSNRGPGNGRLSYSKSRIKNLLSFGVRRFRHFDHIQLPGFFPKVVRKPGRLDKTLILSTHGQHAHSAGWYSQIRYDQFLVARRLKWIEEANLINLDINSTVLNLCINEGFKPSQPILKSSNKKLPYGNYIAVQFRANDFTNGFNTHSRNSLEGESFRRYSQNFLAEIHQITGLDILITSEYESFKDLPYVFDYTGLGLWEKIVLHINSQDSIVAHSGFGMVCSIYRGIGSLVYLPNKEAPMRNPPLQVFENVVKRSKQVYVSRNALIEMDHRLEIALPQDILRKKYIC